MNIATFNTYQGIALIEENKSYSYQDLYAQIEIFKEKLKNGLEKGDVVCIKSDYSFESIALFLALSQFNCIIVPIVPTTDAEFQSKIKASMVNKIIRLVQDEVVWEIISTVEEEIPRNYAEIVAKNHSGLVLFSSGTTGEPKVMVHDLSRLLDSFVTPRKTKNLNFLLFLLFDHIGGINTLLSCLNIGAEISPPINRNPEYILQLIQDKKVQILPTTPTFLNLLLMTENFESYDLSSLKMITYGTERMPQILLEKIKSKIPQVKLLQTFGTSETGIMKTESKSSHSLFFKIIDPDYQYKIVEDQLYLKSKNQVKGYVNQDSTQFAEGEWFATGDMVETDDEGFIKIIGRLNNIINVGGQKVLPKEVEDVINEIEEVVDTTVYAKANVITGQMVCAEVILSENVDEVAMKKKILTKCRNELDKYKIPSKIIFRSSLHYTHRFKKSSKN